MKSYIIPIVLILIATSCGKNNALLEMSLDMAGDNRPQLEAVIAHYGNDPMKREAAEWLIANMPGHMTVWSEGIQAFADSVMHRGLSQERGNELWDSLRAISGPGVKMTDIEHISADFLIDNIDRAFEAWEKSPWHDEVDFEKFKTFVLPYRVDTELLRMGWRDSLTDTYSSAICGVSSAKEAFERIKLSLNSERRNAKFNYPYLMDPAALRNHYSGVCIERCVLFAGICRALGLPVAIDNCGKWANYSNNSHSWVALVLDDGTYTIVDDDSVARKHNIIDTSTFYLNRPMPEGYPYTPEFRKRVVKVWRQTYGLNKVTPQPQFRGKESKRLSSPRLVDVSADYGITGSVEITPTANVDDVWLCTHALVYGWLPQAHAAVSRGVARFDNIGDSVVMLPMGIAGRKEIPVGLPFYLSNGYKVEISPDTTCLLTATFTRKYPINAGWLTRYNQIPGARLEGSNNRDFSDSDTLFTISDVPVFYNSATITSPKPYRYFRIIAERPSYANMDRFNIYDKAGKMVLSEPWGKKSSLDLGKPSAIGRVEYFPWNDANFVTPDHEYELAFWDRERWQPVGRQLSRGYELTFDSIPAGALLILHDLTEGKEERPFTLQDGRQIWW